MRISSSSFYTASLTGMLDQQSAISKLSQQIVSGNRLTTAADDPVAATQAMSINDRLAQATRYLSNIQSVGLTQTEESTVLDRINKDLNTVRDTLAGVTGSADTSVMKSSAAMISAMYKDILDLSNYKDSSGNYIFAGFNSKTQPYSHTAVYGTATTTSGASTFSGDAGTRQVQIGRDQTVQANDSLESVMQSGTASDLLQNLDQAAADLVNNPAGLQTTLNNVYSLVSTAIDNLQGIQAGLAARQGQVGNQKDSVNQMLTANQNALSDLLGIDQASAIVELQTRQTSLEAAQTAFSQIAKLSVFNYL